MYGLSHIPFQTIVLIVIAALAIPVARAEGWLPSGPRSEAEEAGGTRTRLTRLGWGAVGVTMLTLMAAGSTGNNLLYLLYGAVVSSLIISALAGWWNLNGLKVETETPVQVFRASDFPLSLKLTRTGSWPAFGVAAVLGESRAQAAALRKGETAVLELRARAANRGWNDLHGIILESRFPWGLIVHRRALPPAKALALPRLREIHGAKEIRAEARASGRPSLRKGSGDELFGIRPYDPGDDLRKINWKLSARAGKALVNEYCEMHDSKITVTVPSSRGEDAERRIEEAASACRYYIDSGVEVRLVTPESEVDYGKGLLHLDRLLLTLALLGDGRAARPAEPASPPSGPRIDDTTALRRTTFALAVLVYASVFLVDEVDPRLWALMLPLLPLGWRVQEKRLSLVPDAVWSILSAAVLGYAVLVHWRAGAVIAANTLIITYLLANRLMTPFKRAELRQTFLIFFVAFFLVSGLTISPWYFAFFLGYLGLAAVWLWLASGIAWESRRAWGASPAGWAATCAVLALFIFAATPRVEGLKRISPLLAGLNKLQAKSSVATGFSENVSLGWFGELKRSSARVMRVDLAQGAAVRPPALRIRGAAYDLFDGIMWKKEAAEFHYSRGRGRTTSTAGRGWAMRKGLELRFPVGSAGTSTSYRFSMYPMGLSVLFTVGTPWFVGGIDDNAYFDHTDSLYVAKPYLNGMRYIQFSEGSPVNPRVGVALMDERLKQRYLQLPPDPGGKVAALARTAAGKAADEAAQASAIERYLQSHFSYSTYSDSKGRSLSSFLFQSKKGNCEYFASAGVVLMRELGIPARLVTGFLAGDWNQYGQFFDVRQRSAHAWVEAYLPDRGWTTFDPTPAQGAFSLGADALSLKLQKFIDAFQGEWYRTVIGYDQSSQRDTFARIGVALSLDKVFTVMRWLFIGLALGWILWGVTTTLAEARERWQRAARLGAYGRAEALLSRAGLTRAPEMTPREYAAWVARRRPELLVIKELAETHYRQRYAGADERGESERLLRELSSRL